MAEQHDRRPIEGCRLLDLFCGAGGAAVGYSRAGFTDIVGVDFKPQPHYPFEFVQADAIADFDTLIEEFYPAVIHASPPCQAYVQRNKNLPTKHLRLIEPIRELLTAWGGPYVIENVLPEVLRSPVMLCGTQFGLHLRRHRYFETNACGILSRSCHHWGTVAHGQFAAVYARGGKGPRHGAGVREPGPRTGAPSAAEAMGIDWMDEKEITQAIPPAYTQYIGERLILELDR